MEHVDSTSAPAVIDDVKRRYYGSHLRDKFKGQTRRKEKAPAILALFNVLTQAKPTSPAKVMKKDRMKKMYNKMQEQQGGTDTCDSSNIQRTEGHEGVWEDDHVAPSGSGTVSSSGSFVKT